MCLEEALTTESSDAKKREPTLLDTFKKNEAQSAYPFSFSARRIDTRTTLWRRQENSDAAVSSPLAHPPFGHLAGY